MVLVARLILLVGPSRIIRGETTCLRGRRQTHHGCCRRALGERVVGTEPGRQDTYKGETGSVRPGFAGMVGTTDLPRRTVVSWVVRGRNGAIVGSGVGDGRGVNFRIPFTICVRNAAVSTRMDVSLCCSFPHFIHFVLLHFGHFLTTSRFYHLVPTTFCTLITSPTFRKKLFC